MTYAEPIETKTLNFKNTFSSIEAELNEGLVLYWNVAGEILQGSGVQLSDMPPGYTAVEKNFFSALFLYSYFRARIPPSRRILYVAANQCLRGMVTGCDNILDDEYKQTLATDLPEKAHRFRSILDIMVSDRIFFELICREYRLGAIFPKQLSLTSYRSLHALLKSGVQEASEEGGRTGAPLTPEAVLTEVHHYKTGILFQCPWSIPDVLEDIDDAVVSPIQQALYKIGIGCQILDDMVDLSHDLAMNRHNYVASLIWHETRENNHPRFAVKPVDSVCPPDDPDLMTAFPKARLAAGKSALHYLEDGLGALLAREHRFLLAPAVAFIVSRIGADRYLTDIESPDTGERPG